MERILFIRTNPRFEKQTIVPPMGIMYIAASLRSAFPDRQFDMKVVDLGLEKLYAPDVETILKSFEPDLVCLSGLTFEAKAIHELMALVRKASPKARMVVGGPHATCMPDDLLKDPNTDIVVTGEGEITLVELFKALEKGNSLEGVKGISYRVDGEIKKNPPRTYNEDLDSLPNPAWDLIDIAKYSAANSMNGLLAKKSYMCVFTSRACPYGCVYCHPIFGKRFRARSVENVVEELRVLQREHGVKEIHILDDIFNWDLDRAKAICDGIVDAGLDLKIAFPNGLRADRMDDELLDKLKEAGTYMLTYAIETASPRLQKLIGKNLDLERARTAIAAATDKGLITNGFFMLGFPTETTDELEATISYAKTSKLLKANFFNVIPFPGSKLYDLAKEQYPEYDLTIDSMNDMQYWSREPFYTMATGVDLGAIQRRAYRDFFFHGTRLFKLFRRLPRKWFLVRGFYDMAYVMWAPFAKAAIKYFSWTKRFKSRPTKA